MSQELRNLGHTLAYQHAVQVITAGCMCHGARPYRLFDLRNKADAPLRASISQAVRYLELRKLLIRNKGELHMARILPNRLDDRHVLP